MNKKLLYKKAYRILENSTPLKFDCGLVCNSKCCTGSENDGMHLFPDEDIIFSEYNTFLKFNKEYHDETEIIFAVCGGKCNRKFRPIWCRVFPLAPYVDVYGKLSVIEDPRAKYICPLLRDKINIDKFFAKNIYNIFRLLIQDEVIYNYLFTVSRILDEYSRFTSDNN